MSQKVLSLNILLQSTGTATGWLEVRNSEFGFQGSEFVQNFTEVKRDGGFLDIGFSSCTAPTFCRSLVILEVQDSEARFGIQEERGRE